MVEGTVRDQREGGSGSPSAMRKKEREALAMRGQVANGLPSPAERPTIHLASCFVAMLVTLFLPSCAAPPDKTHRIVISAKDQKLALLEKDKLIGLYPVSTS